MAQNAKHALITGSSRGIGRGIALKLAGQGVKVAINYRKNEAAAKDTLAKVKQRGSDGFIVQADVCRPDDITRMFARVKSEFGKLDIFVSNARPDVPEFYQGPMNITLEQWDTAMNSQAKAFLVAVRAACPLMGEGGRIVAITYAPGGRTGSWQPGVDRGQRAQHPAGRRPGHDSELARRGQGMDADGPARHAGGRRECRLAPVLGGRGLDHRPGHRSGRRLVADGRGAPARHSARIAPEGDPLVSAARRPPQCTSPLAQIGRAS